MNRTNLWHTTPAGCIYNVGLDRQSSPHWGQSAHQRCAAQPQAWSTRNQSRYQAHFVPPTDRHTPVSPEPAVCSTPGTPVSQRTPPIAVFSVARMFQATHARALTNGAATASDAASFCSCTCSFGNRTLAMSTLQFSRKGGAIPFYIGLLNHCRNHLSERLNISRVRLFATDCTSARLTGMQMSAFICDLHSAHLL